MPWEFSSTPMTGWMPIKEELAIPPVTVPVLTKVKIVPKLFIPTKPTPEIVPVLSKLEIVLSFTTPSLVPIIEKLLIRLLVTPVL